jgi:type IV pilus assembly protein PilA
METTRSATLLRIAREALAKRSNQADEGADSGFTLIELMVVLLILAILLAIAIPTFLGVTVSAHDRAAQSNLTNAMTAAKASFVQGQSYQATTAGEVASLTSAEPSLSFTGGTSAGQGQISVGVYKQTPTTTSNPDVIVIAAYAQNTGHCWWAEDTENSASSTFTGLPTLAPGTAFAENNLTSSAKCQASVVGNIPTMTNKSYPVV